MTSDRLRVSFVCEHLLRKPRDGYRTYIRGLMAGLPTAGVEVEPVVGWHRSRALHSEGLSHARRLRRPAGRMVSGWARGRGPGADGEADVLHAPTPLFPATRTGPLVVTVHDTFGLAGAEEDDLATGDRPWLEQLAAADLVIVPSQATAAGVQALPSAPPVRVIPHGTDLGPPDPDEMERALERLGVERPYVLWVGRVEPRKNPEGVVRGFVAALESGLPQREQLGLYLVGPPGWWRAEVAQFVESKGFTERVRRLGVVPRQVLPALYAGAEAFVFPSFAEGFGFPVLEAMACGSPVVVSNRPALTELVGDAAVLCDPEDPESVGEALAKVLTDPGLADGLRELGARRAEEFTWERTARETAAVYRELRRTT